MESLSKMDRENLRMTNISRQLVERTSCLLDMCFDLHINQDKIEIIKKYCFIVKELNNLDPLLDCYISTLKKRRVR